VDGSFPQLLGRRTFKQVWDRQVRWAKLRRTTFKALFATELLSMMWLPVLAAYISGGWYFAVLYAFLWIEVEGCLAVHLGWPFKRTAAWVREFMLPAVLTKAWFGKSISWRGNKVGL
jgi:ceramide glucosyltransferase